jgi:DNA (cytosine-5)-methyltransferase 1
MNKLKLLDLFSGIGGFSLGLESTGYFQTIAFVEKDKFCRKVLQKNFNNIPIEEDIRNVRGSNYAADVITGGFPCQPFSVAGKRKGTADDRYLWDETIRVITECKARWFIGENVEGLININNGMVLRQVQTDLEEQGFQVQCIVIPASGIGAWHQRKRIWIVAYSDSNRHSNKIRGSSTKEERISQEHRQDHNTTRKSSRASSVWDSNNKYVSNTNDKGLQRFNSEQIAPKQKLRFTSNKNDERSKTWWQTQSELCGVPNGISYELDKDRSNRIKALGNSIVPQIARQIGLSIMKAELS